MTSLAFSVQIIAIHIDLGFMRLDESAKVVQALESIGLQIHLIDGEPHARQATTHKRRPARNDHWLKRIVDATAVAPCDF